MWNRLKKKAKEKAADIPFLLILLCSVIMILYYTVHKNGYFIDEGINLVMSNGHYNGAVTTVSDYDVFDFLRDYVIGDAKGLSGIAGNIKTMLLETVGSGNYSDGGVSWYDAGRAALQGKTTWVDGRVLWDQIVAEKGARFQYQWVYINYAADNHPILYGLLVHTVFSLFPGTYSIFYLAAINLLFSVLSAILLYKMILQRTSDRAMAVFVMAFWVFSQGFLTTSIFYRMYDTCIFFVVLSLYVHSAITEDAHRFFARKRNYFLLGSCFFFGFNSQYFFSVFYAFLFIVTVCKIKDKVCRKKYIVIHLAAGFLSLLLWPFSLYHMFFSTRGQEAVSKVGLGGMLLRMRNWLNILSTAFTWKQKWLFLLLLLLILLINFAAVLFKKKPHFLLPAEWWIPAAGYYAVVSQIAPYMTDRYMMIIYPAVSLMLAAGIWQIVRFLTGKKALLRLPAAGMLVLVSFILTVAFSKPNYYYPDNPAQEKMCLRHILAPSAVDLSASSLSREGASSRKQYDCLLIAPEHCYGFTHILSLSEFHKVLVTAINETDSITPLEDKGESGMIIYLHQNYQMDEFRDFLLERLEQPAMEETECDLPEYHAYKIIYPAS